MKNSLIAAAILVALGAVAASAQYQVPQQTSYAMNQAERANLQLVHDFWRDIMLGGNLDIASHYMPATFIKNFSTRPKLDIKDAWVTPPTLELITGNFYLKFDQRTEMDPTDRTKMAVFYRFDMVRVDEGLIQEHWDVAFPNGIQPR